MGELFEDEETDLVVEETADEEGAVLPEDEMSISDARRRLEYLLEEKRLRDELEDFDLL